MSQFCLSLSGVELKRVFMQCPERLGKLILLTLLSLSAQGNLFLARKFPFGSKQCQPGGWDDAGKKKHVLSFLFVQLFSGFSVPLVAKVY